VFMGFQWSAWWVYIIVFGLHWAALSSYWDFMFGYDNFWFSGFVTGLAILPMIFINVAVWPILVLRAGLLSIVWGMLHKWLANKPGKFMLWRKDVAEELLRYFFTL